MSHAHTTTESLALTADVEGSANNPARPGWRRWLTWPKPGSSVLAFSALLAAAWSVSARLTGRGVDFLMLIVLAHLLTPADFGTTALALSIVLVLETLMEIPLVQSLTSIKQLKRSHIDTAFTLGLLRGVAILAVLAPIAPIFSAVYGDPRLAPLVLALAMGPVARGLPSPNMVHFIRALNFRMTFIAEVSGKVIAALAALVVLYLGGGYWAIAVNVIMSAVGTTTITYILAPYRPRLCLREWTVFRAFLGWFTLAQMVSALNWQFDRLLLGRFVTPARLGQYTMASDLAVLPSQTLITPAMQPLLAALASISDDAARLSRAFLKAARFAMLIAAPACIGMSLTADLTISVLLGDQWPLAINFLQYIALTLIPAAYGQPLFALAFLKGRTIALLHLQLVELGLRILLLPMMMWAAEIYGVIGARGAIAVGLFIVTMIYVKRFLGLRVTTQLLSLWKIFAACVVMAGVVVNVRNGLDHYVELPQILELATVAAAGASCYFVTLFLLGVRPNSRDISLP